MGVKVLSVTTLLQDLYFSSEITYDELEEYLNALSQVMLLRASRIFEILDVAKEGCGFLKTITLSGFQRYFVR